MRRRSVTISQQKAFSMLTTMGRDVFDWVFAWVLYTIAMIVFFTVTFEHQMDRGDGIIGFIVSSYFFANIFLMGFLSISLRRRFNLISLVPISTKNAVCYIWRTYVSRWLMVTGFFLLVDILIQLTDGGRKAIARITSFAQDGSGSVLLFLIGVILLFTIVSFPLVLIENRIKWVEYAVCILLCGFGLSYLLTRGFKTDLADRMVKGQDSWLVVGILYGILIVSIIVIYRVTVWIRTPKTEQE